MIYFDNSATTMPYPEALRTYQEVSTKIFGNPSSLHQLGTSATRILEASRKQVADLIGKSADEIFFTSGGTEGYQGCGLRKRALWQTYHRFRY